MSDDMTFCLNADKCDCTAKTCERHPGNIKHPELLHSYSNFYNTDICPLRSKNLQPTCNKLATDKISQFIDGIEEMFADIRERFIDDSVCGLCEYDGAYVGESGDWCNK